VPASFPPVPAAGLTLLLGGARSGKSDLALRMASAAARDLNAPVTFVATAVAGDQDMEARIARHREDRPTAWSTVEAPHFSASDAGAIGEGIIVIDCITMLTSNLTLSGCDDSAVLDHAGQLGAALSRRPMPSIVISNEVGMGVVPATDLGRTWRDTHGRANRLLVGHAQESLLVIAGATLPLTMWNQDHHE